MQQRTQPRTQPRTQQRNVGIMIFEEVEVLDFAGPFEVFNVTAELNDPAPFNVYTIAETAAPVKTRGKLNINPNYTIYSMPQTDILIIPGGAGCRALLNKPNVLEWLREQTGHIELLATVCTGSLVAAKAGILDGLPATTHHDNLDDLRRIAPSVQVVTDKRFIDNGKILTSGGISAGIDASLYIVRRLLGDEVLKKTLAEMEYHWTPDDDLKWPAGIAALG